MNVVHMNTHFKKDSRKEYQAQTNAHSSQTKSDEFLELALWFTKEIQREHVGLPVIGVKKYKEAR